MGSSAAFNIAKDTKLTVALIEKSTFGGGSSGGSAAITRHYYSTELMVRSAIESTKIFKDFKNSVGEPLEFVPNGWVAFDSGEPAKTSAQRVKEMQAHGCDSVSLTVDELRKTFPHVHVYDDEVGSWDRDAGFVAQPAEACAIYARQAAKRGAKVYDDTAVKEIKVASGKIKSVVTSKGEITTSTVINSSGPWGSRVAKMVGLDYPIRAVRQQLIDLKPAKPWPLTRATISDRRNLTYILPRAGGIAHAGYHPYGKEVDPDNFSTKMDQGFADTIIPMLVARVPELKNAKIAHGFSALYEDTPDIYPLVGESKDLRGFIMCAGWSGHGFKHGPYFGWILKELVEKGKTPVDISMLKPERFKTGKGIETPYTKTKAPYG